MKYLDETKDEYLHPVQPYINKQNLPNLWLERKSLVDSLDEKIDFKILDQIQIAGPRVYVNSNDKAYNVIRELSLPNITYISIVKLKDKIGRYSYYFRLFANYFGEDHHPQQELENLKKEELTSESLQSARKGQGKYRKGVLKLCPFCPITLIGDDRLLTASHIKPWSHRETSDFEKTDPYNGFMLSPTIDRLFDRGYLSFSNDKKSILSPFLSNMTYSQIGISDNKIFKHLPTEGREKYLEFHRNNILLR